jgi:hypothetical protein
MRKKTLNISLSEWLILGAIKRYGRFLIFTRGRFCGGSFQNQDVCGLKLKIYGHFFSTQNKSGDTLAL